LAKSLATVSLSVTLPGKLQAGLGFARNDEFPVSLLAQARKTSTSIGLRDLCPEIRLQESFGNGGSRAAACSIRLRSVA
jgi:hypothetical protein